MIKNFRIIFSCKRLASIDETNVYNQALAQVTDAVNAQKDYIHSQVENTVKEQVKAQISAVVVQQMKDKGITDEMMQNDEEGSSTGFERISS